VDAVIGTGPHDCYGKLIWHRSPCQGSYLSRQHAIECRAWRWWNPGGEDELVRAGADGLLINEDLIDPVHDRSCQRRECAPSTEPDASSFREGINFQQRLFCDLHLSNPRCVISSTMLSRRDNISSRPVDRIRAFFARLLCSSMTLMQFCLTTSSGYWLL